MIACVYYGFVVIAYYCSCRAVLRVVSRLVELCYIILNSRDLNIDVHPFDYMTTLRIYYPCALSRRCEYDIYVIWITTRALLLYGNTAFSIGMLQSVIVGCLVLSIFEVLGSSTQSSLLFGYCPFLWS